MTPLLILKSITFAYDPREDRVLAVVNPGQTPSWSCWLTRRLVLSLLDNGTKFLANTSPLVQRAAPEARREVAAFEREAAVANTAPAMSVTPPEVLKMTVAAAELVHQVTLTQHGERVRMEIHGVAGGGSEAGLTRAELQRILDMLHAEVVKAGWSGAPATSPRPASPPEEPKPKPARHWPSSLATFLDFMLKSAPTGPREARPHATGSVRVSEAWATSPSFQGRAQGRAPQGRGRQVWRRQQQGLRP